jgi:formylglycine-generating enzyme required for sulfatase activity
VVHHLASGSRLQDDPPRTPIVFISSTREDLEEYRAKAEEAVKLVECVPRMMKYFAVSGEHPPLEACLKKISGSELEPPADVLVVIVAHRYGWVPEDQPNSDRKSITWLECEEARRRDKEVLAFLVKEDFRWPPELHEQFRLYEAAGRGNVPRELSDEVVDNVARLRQFKEWLRGIGVTGTFDTPESLCSGVIDALHRWLNRKRKSRASAARPAEPAGDPRAYLRLLCDQISHFEIGGLRVGRRDVVPLSIEELYIPLRTTLPEAPGAAREEERRALVELGVRHSAHVELHEALQHRVVLVTGDPGSGKTTFLRRIAYLLGRSLLGIEPGAAETRLGLPGQPLPVLIRLVALVQHIAHARDRREGPWNPESSQWLAHFLSAQSGEEKTNLTREYFEHQLVQGSAIVLLDGLDEGPSHQERIQMVNLVVNAARVYKNCRFVLTSRPAAFRDDLVAPDWVQVQIDDLEDDAIDAFLEGWCQRLYGPNSREAKAHWRELTGALHARPEIRRLARTPVMLTGLAVVHWNEKRLPEQRADLYKSILTWLAHSRPRRPGRLSPEKCLQLHRELALAMQDHPEGRQLQISRYEAAEAIDPQWRDLPDPERLPAAEAFLREEELDSGIVVSRGNQLSFWHSTFQEYLAAQALAACREEERRDRLLGQKKLFRADWKETVLLLGEVLLGQGTARVDAMLAAILKHFGEGAPLLDQARCVGLVGAVVRDLSPAGYEVRDHRFRKLLREVLAIFDRERSESVPIETRIAVADALGQVGDPRIDPRHAAYWVPIPAGDYLLGAQNEDPSRPNYDPDALSDEGPVHEVHLDEYAIARYLVTVGEYRRFVESGAYQHQLYWEKDGFGEYQEPGAWEEQLEHPNRPVVLVSWYEAMAYSSWAQSHSSSARCRLPTEAEWERAARGPAGGRYPWGEHGPGPATLNYREARARRPGPTPVGVYPMDASAYGVLDMGGNVREWCWDRFGRYVSGRAADRADAVTASARVVRGGACDADASGCRVTLRNWRHPSERNAKLGFRVVRVAGAKSRGF